MKRAFTMIELIFVILILGILAVIIIPRIAANRDDAYFVRVLKNSHQFIDDIMAYRMSQGDLPNDSQSVTGVSGVNFSGQVNIDGMTFPAIVSFKDRECDLKFIFTKLSSGLIVMKLQPGTTSNACPILIQDGQFDILKNSEYPIAFKKAVY